MLKKTVEFILFSGTVPLGVMLAYAFYSLFRVTSEEGVYQMLSIIMVLIVLLAVLLVLFLYKFNFHERPFKDRIKSLIGRKVFGIGGDFLGVISDVLLAKNAIYGLKVVVQTAKSKRHKIIIKRKDIRVYGDVVLVDDDLTEKFI